ncbi:D-3-phosphoglycerate dehydrogenase [hydrothermal vent metagenome]|uniref:D-3-phosphoglycerate dehydrogenase n=1 Tax=hydrothermal vent metagenome TaxID=652676 RepID=A0A3B1C0V5_9ZZZZ
MTARILVSDKLSQNGIDILKATPGIEVDVKTGMTPAELISIIGQYDGLIIRSATRVTEEVLKAGASLKAIGRAGIGVDNVDTKAASRKGVVVMNTPGGNTTTTAEHAVAMMMALSRKIPQATASVKKGKWEKSKFMGSEHYGKTLGILGIGRIGSIVAKRAHGLEMKVIAFDPFISLEAADNLGIELVTIDDFFARSDYISIHTPKTPETTHIINKEAFAKMKKGVRIINCARGGIINEQDLAQAVKDGIVAGAALDVFESEPPAIDNPLLALDEVILTPHLGASTSEAQENVAIAVADQMVKFFTTGLIQNAVNVPSIDPDQLSVIKPYLALGEKMGSFLAQAVEGGVKEVNITYMGDLADIDQRSITQSIVKGVLEVFAGEAVNFINAPFLAESRGIVVSSGTSSVKRNFSSLLGLKIVTDTGEMYIEGAVFMGGEPRLVKLGDYLVETQLKGNMLVFTNNDKPGVIGNIGTYLGREGVNIASFELSREKKGGVAMSIVSIDSALSSDQIKRMKKIENVVEVNLVRL